MDPLIEGLQNATSSAQLIAAVDALPRNEKYYTEQVRDLLLQQKHLIVDSATADAVTSFLLEFGCTDAGRAVLRIPEIRDLLIIVVAPLATRSPKSVYYFGRSIVRIVFKSTPAAELYSTPESFKAILSCFHQVTTDESALWIASSINNILTGNPSAKYLLNDLPVAEAFSALLPNTTTDEAAKWVANSMWFTLDNNDEAQKLFGTPTFFEKFKTIEKFGTSEDAKKSFKLVVDILQPVVARRVALEKPLRDATASQQLISALNTIMKQSDFWTTLVDILLTKQHLILDEESTISTAKFIKWSCEKNGKSTRKREMYELFQNVLLPQSLNFTDSIPHVHESLFLILKITFVFHANKQGQAFFSTTSVKEYVMASDILTWLPHVHEALSLTLTIKIVFSIIYNKEAQAFFSTTSVKEYVMASLPHSNESLLRLLNSLFADNKKGQEIFGTPDFRKKLETKFVSNTFHEFTTVMKLLNDQIIQVRFEALKQLAAIHKEDIPERLLQKLSEAEIDPALLLTCDSAMLLAAGAKVKEVAVLLMLIKNVKDKNNGVAPIHQDPFKMQELERLRQEHDDLRKFHQDLVASSSKSTNENLKKLDDQESKIGILENKINGLEMILADEKTKSSNLENSLDDTKKQLQCAQQEISALQSQLAAISPFVKDKFYQIEYGILNLPQPQAGVVADLRPVPSQSRIFAEAEKLMKKSGTLVFDSTSPSGFKFSPVKGFTLQSVDVILRNTYSFEERMDRLQGLRADLTDKFNPAFAAFSPEQQQVLKVLFEHFLPRPPNANKKFPNLVNVFHGTKIDCLDSAIKGLVAMKSTDEGFFGFGCYTTTSIEYAAKYARGDFDPAGPSPARADGCYPVLWCVAAVGVCNPISRADDYSKNRVHKTIGRISNFFGSPLSKDCDCHCALVSGSQSYQAVAPQHMEHLEIVVDQENQVIPIAVLWVKP